MKAKNKIFLIIFMIALVLGSVFATTAVQNKRLTELEAAHAAELEQIRTETEALQEQLQFYEEMRQSVKEILIELINCVDYGEEPVYVIGHQSPDSDTVAASIGMAYLLNSLGISAEPRTASHMNLETEYAFSELGVEVPKVLEDAAGKQLWLVDHSESTQMVNGASEARIVGILDHHGIGELDVSDLINVLSCPAGSSCSVITVLLDACGVEIPQEIADVLVVGILSDTSNMKSNTVTTLDEKVLAKLKEISAISDTDAMFNGMLEAKMSYKGLDEREIFYSDYKLYEHKGHSYGIGCIKVARPDLIPAMAERMQKVICSEIESGFEGDFLMYHVYDPDYSTGYTGYCGKDKEFTEALMEGAFGDSGEKQGEYYVFMPSLSRKKNIVPPIDAYLDALQ